ncbi:MAG TPA: hypothetical protein H9678_06390, partial [Firmicutes bacterium]|nr:hypothetical protein [Bacillota bacterium]
PLIGSAGNLPAFRFITVHLSHSSCVIVPQQTPPLFYLAVFMYIPAGSGACSKALKKLFGFLKKAVDKSGICCYNDKAVSKRCPIV